MTAPAWRSSLKEELSSSEARRVALTAQGFNGMDRVGDVGAVALPNAIRRLGLLQIDTRRYCDPGLPRNFEFGVIQAHGFAVSC